MLEETCHFELHMDQELCFKNWLEVFLKALTLLVYLDNSHDESINYIFTHCSKDNYTVCETQVLFT